MKNKLLKILNDINSDIDYINEKDLVDAGTIDSLEIMQIVVEIEQSFKIEIDSDDVNEDNFNSIEAMISLIEKYKEK